MLCLLPDVQVTKLREAAISWLYEASCPSPPSSSWRAGVCPTANDERCYSSAGRIVVHAELMDASKPHLLFTQLESTLVLANLQKL